MNENLDNYDYYNMETLYQHHYAIKFEIYKKLSKNEIKYLKNTLFQMLSDDIGIITASINKLPDDMMFISEMDNIFIGERIIPLSLYQQRVQKSELIFIWNELIQKFGNSIKFFAIEHGSIKKKLAFPSYNTLNAILPKIINYKNYQDSINKKSYILNL